MKFLNKIFTIHIDVFLWARIFSASFAQHSQSNLEIMISSDGALPEIQDFMKAVF